MQKRWTALRKEALIAPTLNNSTEESASNRQSSTTSAAYKVLKPMDFTAVTN